MENKVEKITADMNEGKLEQHLQAYREQALEMGASRAAVIRAEEIPVDDRIPLKCQIPRCFGYGVGAQCPPNTLKPAELREYLKQYKRAVFFTIDLPPEVIVRNKATIKERIDATHKLLNMVSQIESMAFYDGHYLAFGLGAGSCRHGLCAQHDDCQAMKGERCRFSLRSRPAMEAVGIDVYKLVAGLGWDIYPIGSGAKPESIPNGILAGIVIVQ